MNMQLDMRPMSTLVGMICVNMARIEVVALLPAHRAKADLQVTEVKIAEVVIGTIQQITSNYQALSCK